MEYIVFLIYALVYYIILGVKLLQSSDENKKESEQKRKAQQAKALKKICYLVVLELFWRFCV